MEVATGALGMKFRGMKFSISNAEGSKAQMKDEYFAEGIGTGIVLQDASRHGL